jgi:hypothetical protein
MTGRSRYAAGAGFGTGSLAEDEAALTATGRDRAITRDAGLSVSAAVAGSDPARNPAMAAKHFLQMPFIAIVLL